MTSHHLLFAESAARRIHQNFRHEMRCPATLRLIAGGVEDRPYPAELRALSCKFVGHVCIY